MNNLDNLNKLKKALIKKNIDAYLVPKNDFFFNEFIKTGNDRLRYVSNFTGSAGTALILHKKNYLFVSLYFFIDYHYFLYISFYTFCFLEGYQSSQMGRAVNPLAPAFEGANPSPSTIKSFV